MCGTVMPNPSHRQTVRWLKYKQNYVRVFLPMSNHFFVKEKDYTSWIYLISSRNPMPLSSLSYPQSNDLNFPLWASLLMKLCYLSMLFITQQTRTISSVDQFENMTHIRKQTPLEMVLNRWCFAHLMVDRVDMMVLILWRIFNSFVMQGECFEGMVPFDKLIGMNSASNHCHMIFTL